ncbi:S41 family peptidase [Undibacterium sp. Di27W]|uniref:S41 family peptidase n=1 Tax=Undibacterium sp. Di27W TaxID=3413036 RepID=UPI003BF3F90E
MRTFPRLLLALLTASALGLNSPVFADTAAPVPASFAQDFEIFWQYVDENYAYFDARKTDWKTVHEKYGQQVKSITSKRDFVAMMEAVVAELYDSHAHLATSLPHSPRLVPTGTDLWAEWQGQDAIITDVRANSAAERAGLRVGMKVLEVHGQLVAQAVTQFGPPSLKTADPVARDWALRVALAGPRNQAVKIKVTSTQGQGQAQGQVQEMTFTPGVERPATPLSSRNLDEIGYIRINNSLGDSALIAAFDEALGKLENSKALILDLRDTPSGGNTFVARGMMGRLISQDQAYQKHELVSEMRESGIKRSWVEYVSPRGKFIYKQPIVVLAGHWTGSMGEGMTIALDGMQRATIVGTRMAGLLGALGEVSLPHAGFIVRIPNEKLFHLNGTPRESFVPGIAIDTAKQEPGKDAALDVAVDLLRRQLAKDSK